MSANFYTNAGLMVGCDVHSYWTGPGQGLKTFAPHAVFAPLSWACATSWKRTASVTANGDLMIQGGFELYLVPHIPMTLAPPGAAEPLEYLGICSSASSKPLMKAHSVTAANSALAVCMSGFSGLNVDCNEPVSAPSAGVVCATSVQTTPTVGDVVAGVVEAALSTAMSFAAKPIMKRIKAPEPYNVLAEQTLKHIYRRRNDVLPSQMKPSFPADAVQRLIDGEAL